MLMEEKAFAEKYGSLYRERLARVQACVNDPEILRKEISAVKSATKGAVFPVPKADEFTYRMIQYNGFIRYPKRLQNFLIAENESRELTRSFLPTIMDIEPTSRCNFRCIMCQVRDWQNGRRADDLSFTDFKKIIDEEYGLTEVKLQGFGEPLLNKDFFKMLEYLTQRFIWVRTTVNGSILHLHENYKQLIDYGINEVQTSFDGATKEVFEKIRPHSNFERVVENLKYLNRYANSKGSLVTRMWVLIQEHNKHQIFDFLDLAKYMEFKRLTFSIGMSDFGQEKWEANNKTLQVKEFLSPPNIEKILHQAKEAGLEVTYWNLAKKYTNNDISAKCPWPFNRSYITSDLKIVPCCMVGNPDVVNFGSAREFKDVWNSPTYQNFRKAHLAGKIPPYCRNCYQF